MVILKLMDIPQYKTKFLEKLIPELSKLVGMVAIVLGGSHASGTHHEKSDLDLGLYYFESKPFSIADIKRIVESISTTGNTTVTDFYDWGAWVNGGAWIHTIAGKVDFLYRNIDQVQRTISEAQQGFTQHDYDQQPTHGFYSVIYLAETQICVPLFDPDNIIANLKRQVENYPPLLKQRIITDSLWSAEFTLLHAHNFAARGDIYNTVGCLTRVTANLTQALFAINEKYFIRDKMVTDTINAFPILPYDYVQQINHILGFPGSTATELAQSVARLKQAWESVLSLANEIYQPKFQM
jgi:predicted nucleotidyltransferase